MKHTSDVIRLTLPGYWCVYCGDVATTLEHFPPKVCEYWGYKLPACSECNNLAGTNFAYDFAERAKLVKEKIRKRHIRLILTPDWADDELQELSGYTQSDCAKWSQRKKWLLERLAWDPFPYIAQIDKDGLFHANPTEDRFVMFKPVQQKKRRRYIAPAKPKKRKLKTALGRQP